MSIKTYIWIFRILALIGVVALGVVVSTVDPEVSGIGGKILFYATLFFVLVAVFNLIFLWARRMMLQEEMVAETLSVSFRQGALLSFLVIILLFLQSARVLVWWDGLLVVAGVSLIELYFLSQNH